MTSPPLRPRYARIGAAGASLAVTLVALLGGVGVLPTSAESAGAGRSSASGAIRPVAGVPRRETATPSATPTSAPTSAPTSTATPSALPSSGATLDAAVLPVRSGQGRRVVFSESAQRVWLVDDDDAVRRTYLVSGSLYDNLDPGSYRVYSRSAQAWGIDDSGTMRWFVRFTRGDNGAAIGFHSIPVDNGRRVQTVDQLGTPQSHGCIRQRTPDATALWAFAPLGTRVVVV